MEFLSQLQLYEAIGGLFAIIVMGWVVFYAIGWAILLVCWYFVTSAVFRVVLCVGVIGGSAWFLFNLIQKYGG